VIQAPKVALSVGVMEPIPLIWEIWHFFEKDLKLPFKYFWKLEDMVANDLKQYDVSSCSTREEA